MLMLRYPRLWEFAHTVMNWFRFRGWLLFIVLLTGCTHRLSAPSAPEVKIIRISGSDTMLILTRLWAEEYMKRHPGASVYVEGGGTATGVRDLIRSKNDICAASRPLRPQEVQELARRYNRVGLTFAVAKEALSVYVHPQNPIRDFTLQQLKEIFTGQIRNWSLLGGPDAPIFVLTRSPNSGTYYYFQEHILQEEPYSPAARILQSTPAVVKAVSENRYAIGYGGVAYGQSMHCRINGIEPIRATIMDDSYPITRYLYLVTTSSPRGIVKDFIDWVLSPRGQALVEEAGYVPLWLP